MVELTFSIYARFQYNTISTDHVPKRKSRDFAHKIDQTVSVTLDELVEFVQDPSIQEWETVVVHFSLTEIRRMLAFGILDTMIDDLKGNRKQLLELLHDGFHIRLTPKDIQYGMDRIRPRIRIELFKPRVFNQFLKFHKDFGLRPELREFMENTALNWEDIETFIHQEMLQANPNSKTELNEKTREILYRKYAVLLYYDFLFFHDDEDLIDRWLRKLEGTVDENLEWLEETVLDRLPSYLVAKAQSDVRKLVGNVQATNLHDQLIEELRRENEEQRETIEMLLSVIESLSPKRPDETARSIPSFKGQRILVIGDAGHMPTYRALVEAMGGTFDFLEGFEKDVQLESKMQSADGIIFVTAYSSHKKFYAMKVEKQFHKCVLVNQAGLGEFERGLEKLRQKMLIAGA